MPLYDFQCPDGHVVEDVRCPADGSEDPQWCPEVLRRGSVVLGSRDGYTVETRELCAKPLTRLFPLVARNFPGAGNWR